MPFGVELRTVDDDGNVLPRDGITSGRLQIRGPWVIAHISRTSAAPATGDDNWFDTGDVAILHPDGTLQITDRVEGRDQVGRRMDQLGRARKCRGRLPRRRRGGGDRRAASQMGRAARCCWSSARQGQRSRAEAILDHLTHHVAKWWLPDEILFVDSLPHTATGKLLKTALREQYKDYRLTSAA